MCDVVAWMTKQISHPVYVIVSTLEYRRLRDRLIEAERFSLAMEVSTKCGLDHSGVWGAAGFALLQAGDFSGAREKFSRCMKVSEILKLTRRHLYCMLILKVSFRLKKVESNTNRTTRSTWRRSLTSCRHRPCWPTSRYFSRYLHPPIGTILDSWDEFVALRFGIYEKMTLQICYVWNFDLNLYLVVESHLDKSPGVC